MGVVMGEIAGNRDQIFAIGGGERTAAKVRQTISKKHPIAARHIWVLKHGFQGAIKALSSIGASLSLVGYGLRPIVQSDWGNVEGETLRAARFI